MQRVKLENMERGWFIGGFSPTALTTDACEAACKHYAAGEREAAHFHKIATEVTLIASGTVQMNGERFSQGDIVVVQPGEVVNFEAIEAATTMVIKIPAVLGDKYLVDEAGVDSDE